MAQNHREQRIMTHNIRGINAPEKWDSLRSRIGESKCDIVYLQETKREYFDASYLQNFCSRQFDQFSSAHLLVLLGARSHFGKGKNYMVRRSSKWFHTIIYAPLL